LVINMDTVTQWEALRDLRLAAEAALKMADATVAVNAPTPENAKALGDRFAAMVEPAFRRALDAGVSRDEAMRVFGGAEAAAVVNGVMDSIVAELHREEEAARRADAAEAAVRVARRRALGGLQIVAAAGAGANRVHVATVVFALRNAVKAGVPLDVALEFLARAGVPGTTALGAALAESRARAADAEARVRSAIPLPEPVRDQSDSGAADADAHVPPPSPTPEFAPDGGASEADLRLIDGAAASIGAMFTESERRIAAGAVNHFRVLAGRTMERAECHRQALGRGRVQRRPRASRAPRRAAHRSAIALTRDGPPPSDDAPPPVASHSPHGAIGGAR
jgi:hypothetical protein